MNVFDFENDVSVLIYDDFHSIPFNCIFFYSHLISGHEFAHANSFPVFPNSCSFRPIDDYGSALFTCDAFPAPHMS